MVRREFPKKRSEERNQEMENILGNLLVAENQVDKLKKRLVELYDGIDDWMPHQENSTYPFIYKNKTYKVHIQIEKMGNEDDEDENPKDNETSESITFA